MRVRETLKKQILPGHPKNGIYQGHLRMTARNYPGKIFLSLCSHLEICSSQALGVVGRLSDRLHEAQAH